MNHSDYGDDKDVCEEKTKLFYEPWMAKKYLLLFPNLLM